MTAGHDCRGEASDKSMAGDCRLMTMWFSGGITSSSVEFESR